ncbi:4-alpha-glucanotransferase [Planobispora siamensis]|uniref:4-alpha-glucanotransferase n=1 Tax=Planobispora siamensis TaxID=936338 RepID=A0A8J3WS96_9ACTN|nr:4-alpha-glucanotransferase [Planobispora siamensis]GIH97681.1 hypothetical protein Psi01_83110 [Planobispora siamensis]
MNDEDLQLLAAAHGVATEYEGWRGRVRVPRRTVVAVLRALGVDPAAPPVPHAVKQAAGSPVSHVLRGPAREAAGPAAASRGPALPEPAWGLMVQLYSLRSSGSWGIGDLHDLGVLAEWGARAHGAGFVLVNPLHATEPVPPLEASPYLPVSRRYRSPLYLRLEDVPEWSRLEPAEREGFDKRLARLKERNRTLDPLDRSGTWAVKRQALRLMHRVPRDGARQAAYAEYRRMEGETLTRFATWCALAEAHGPDWRSWPAALRDPQSAQVAEERKRLAERVDFHIWLQWLLDGQLAAAQRRARGAGMAIGMIHDLALGSQAGGADTWADPELVVQGVSVGAPPDAYNQAGQIWNQLPWHRRVLHARSHRPYRELVRAALRHAGGVRIDHALGLFRQWWVPEGLPPQEGTYVSLDHRASIAVIAEEAARAGAVVVGEDVGLPEPWMQDYLADHGILGTPVLWERTDGAGRPLAPSAWREACMATVATHDYPPVAGYLAGDPVTLRARFGLLTRTAEAERADAARALGRWRSALAGLGLLDPAADPGDADGFTVALHEFLSRTPARLVALSLADAVGERRTQNVPGTAGEYPNWRVPLADAGGAPVLLDDLVAGRSRLRLFRRPQR